MEDTTHIAKFGKNEEITFFCGEPNRFWIFGAAAAAALRL